MQGQECQASLVNYRASPIQLDPMRASHILNSDHAIRTERRSLFESYIRGPYPMEGPKWSREGVPCRFPSGRMFSIRVYSLLSLVIQS